MPAIDTLKRADQHHIDVIMRDGTYHYFTPRVLDVLLEADRVMKFKRSTGWVTVGVDPIRVKRSSDLLLTYHGPERRSVFH